METRKDWVEPRGWIGRREFDLPLPAWQVEIPMECAPVTLRQAAERYVVDACEVWGLRPLTVRWYLTTRERSVAEAQWERTRQ
jgi:hypothetical protein